MKNRKIAIFGAGVYGKIALEQIGKENVSVFIDNDKEKQGSFLYDKEIVPPEAVERYSDCHVIVASLYSDSMTKQLEKLGIIDYSLFLNNTLYGYYETKELVVNPYIINEEALTEKQWSDSSKINYLKKEVYSVAERLYKSQPLFNHIEVETINRCNGSCSFCPVNHKDDPREKAVMSEELFKSIVNQLEEMQYTGRFTTFSNNEPLLDNRILEFNRYARKHLPKARMHMFTNGTLMNLELFIELAKVLDELIIDNYQQDLKLIKPCQRIAEYCKEHPELKEKVTIVLRKPNEILTSRGGTAPNRKELVDYSGERCVLPFKQMIIRPTGQVSLCCNDAIGKFTLGDASNEKLLDIWYGPRFQMVRKCLYEGRENWGNCKLCDTFSLG